MTSSIPILLPICKYFIIFFINLSKFRRRKRMTCLAEVLPQEIQQHKQQVKIQRNCQQFLASNMSTPASIGVALKIIIDPLYYVPLLHILFSNVKMFCFRSQSSCREADEGCHGYGSREM